MIFKISSHAGRVSTRYERSDKPHAQMPRLNTSCFLEMYNYLIAQAGRDPPYGNRTCL